MLRIASLKRDAVGGKSQKAECDASIDSTTADRSEPPRDTNHTHACSMCSLLTLNDAMHNSDSLRPLCSSLGNIENRFYQRKNRGIIFLKNAVTPDKGSRAKTANVPQMRRWVGR
jgi:hypothetical protein